MCENLHYESVYFKELCNDQEYYEQYLLNALKHPYTGDMVVRMRKVLVRFWPWPYRGVGKCASVQLIGIFSRILLTDNKRK